MHRRLRNAALYELVVATVSARALMVRRRWRGSRPTTARGPTAAARAPGSARSTPSVRRRPLAHHRHHGARRDVVVGLALADLVSSTWNRSTSSCGDDAVTNRPHMLLVVTPRRIRLAGLGDPARSARLGHRSSGRSVDPVHEAKRSPTRSRRSRRPCCRRARRRARSRCTASKPRSVATPDVFFGHATHSPPSGTRARATNAGNRRLSSARRVTKKTITSKRPRACARSCTPSGSDPSMPSKPAGGATIATRAPSWMPSFRGQRRARVPTGRHVEPSPPLPLAVPQLNRAGRLSTSRVAATAVTRISRPVHWHFAGRHILRPCSLAFRDHSAA